MAPLALYARRLPAGALPRRSPASRSASARSAHLLVTAPLAFASATIGWRDDLHGGRRRAWSSALLVWWLSSCEPRERPAPSIHETLRESLDGVAEVVRMRGFWPLFLMNVVAYSSYVLIVGLWGGPYLTHVYGYGLIERGELLMLPAISQIAGVVSVGAAPARRRRLQAAGAGRRPDDRGDARPARRCSAGPIRWCWVVLAGGVRRASGVPAGSDLARALDPARRVWSGAGSRCSTSGASAGRSWSSLRAGR